MDGGLCEGDDFRRRWRRFVLYHGLDEGRKFDGGYGGPGDDDALRHGRRIGDAKGVRRPTSSDRGCLCHTLFERFHLL